MRQSLSRATAARAVPLILLVLALSACDLGTNPDNRYMAGEWLVLEFVGQNAANPAQVDTVIPNADWFRFMSFGHGNYLGDNIWSPEDHWDSQSGLWNSNDSIVTVRFSDADTLVWPFEIIDADHVKLTIPGVETFDFDGDSVPDLTNEILRMVRADANPDPDIRGSWVADQYTYTSVADTTVSHDVIADGGAFSITFYQPPAYQYFETVPGGGGDQGGSGDMAALEGLIWLMDGNNVEAGTYSVASGTLIITLHNAEWDFDDDGTDDPATLRLELHRTG